MGYTIWLFNIAMENHHFQWVNLYKWAISHGYVKYPEGKWSVSPSIQDMT